MLFTFQSVHVPDLFTIIFFAAAGVLIVDIVLSLRVTWQCVLSNPFSVCLLLYVTGCAIYAGLCLGHVTYTI